ncbi:MAG: glutathione S-transferase family protein [Acetobacteraceae bacterium]
MQQQTDETDMITLYATGSPNVDKVYITLEELGLPYNAHSVDVFAGAQFTPEFLRHNPLAKLPVVIDDEGPAGKPVTLFESGAILIYLADKAGKLLPADPAARADAIQWVMVQMANLGPMCGQLVHFTRYAPAGNDYAISRYNTQVQRVFDVFEQRLAANAWIAGGDYSIADIAAYPWLRVRAMLLGDAAARFANIARWAEKIGARPAVERAYAEAGKVRAVTTQFEKASTTDLDRLFGRGAFAAA